MCVYIFSKKGHISVIKNIFKIFSVGGRVRIDFGESVGKQQADIFRNGLIVNGIKTHDRLNHCKSPVLMFVCALKAFM